MANQLRAGEQGLRLQCAQIAAGCAPDNVVELAGRIWFFVQAGGGPVADPA